jgi:hypothetical protein
VARSTQVRETMDFAARVQGVGNKAAELQTLLQRETELDTQPDPEIDAFMKASLLVSSTTLACGTCMLFGTGVTLSRGCFLC